MISELRFIERDGKKILQQRQAVFHGDASGALCGHTEGASPEQAKAIGHIWLVYGHADARGIYMQNQRVLKKGSRHLRRKIAGKV